MRRLLCRLAAGLSLRASTVTRAAFTLSLFALFALSAHAVVVRGRVTDALGKPVVNARVQLVEAGAVTAHAYSDAEGRFEVRSSGSGRFTLLTSAGNFLPAVGEDFYGAASEVLNKDIVLSATTVRQEISVTATGVPTPLPQLSIPVTVLDGADFATRVDISDEMRQVPGAYIVQLGQRGGVTSLFLRGGQSDANKVLIDGVPAEDIGGHFDFGTVSSTGLSRVEVQRGPNSALYGSDALASVVNITTPRGGSLKPLLQYSGDAGNLHTYRNEAIVSGARKKLDYLAGFSRFDNANALASDKYHAATAVANLGYALFHGTEVRATLRNAVSATGVPNAHDFYGISANEKQSDQDLYAQGTLENRTQSEWHNLVRYGIARKREQLVTFAPVGTPIVSFGYATYYGNTVTIRGANGTSATGRAAIAYGSNDATKPFFGATFPQRYDLASNRDELYFQSDYAITPHHMVLFGFRYENERGAYRYPVFAISQALQRTNFEYSALFQGDIKNRLFYSLGGALEKNHLYGVRGTPRLGLAWVAVRPSEKKFHGTRLRFDVSRGVQEPSLNVQFSSLYGTLLNLGNTAAIAAYGVTPPQAEEARTYDYGVEQNILGQKMIFKAGYFHTQYDHQFEYVSATALKTYFGIAAPISGLYGAYTNSLTYRAQGMETEIQYQPTVRVFLRGGYTYLAPLVERSFSSDALTAFGSTTNPAFPGVTIGSTSPLVGQRPFRRPPHTGFLAAQYTRSRYSIALRGAFSGRSDDSTFLGGATPAFDNSLLLPNRNLDFGYAKFDLNATVAITGRVTAFAQLENLLNDQHIGPIGFPGLPTTVRAGLKIRIGGE